jgi:hypothetical protein
VTESLGPPPHDLDRKGVAIFDREGIVGAVRSNGHGSLMDPEKVVMVGEILEEYDFGLIPR